MDRRTLLITGATALLATALQPYRARAAAKQSATRWKVRASEGFDAIAFLGPLSGVDLYQKYYAADADAFAPHLPEAVRRDIQAVSYTHLTLPTTERV